MIFKGNEADENTARLALYQLEERQVIREQDMTREKVYPGPEGNYIKDYRTPAPFRYPSTADDLVAFAKDYFNGCIEVMKQRNARYARPDDPFYNLKRGGGFGVAVRLDDKISRLLNLTKHEATIDAGHESIEDTCLDIATYAMLLSAMRANERGSK